MSSAWYHIIVLGTDLGGLVYAALASRAGYRVAVLGQGARPNLYRHEGHVFLRQPERFYGFATSQVVGQVLSELSLAMELKGRPCATDPVLQLVLPDRRLDLTSHDERWRRELEREVAADLDPDRLTSFDAWAAERARDADPALRADHLYPMTGWRAAGRYRAAAGAAHDLLDDAPDPAPVASVAAHPLSRALVAAPLLHLAGVHDGSRPLGLGALPTARLWTHLRGGLYRLGDGLDGLKAMFLRKLVDQCGDHRPHDLVDEIVLRRGRVKEVRLAGTGETLGCELLVVNADPRRVFQLIPTDKRIGRFHATLTSLPVSAWRLTVNLAVDPRVIPRGMAGDVVLIADPAAPLTGDNALWVTRAPDGSFGERDGRPGPGTLQVSALMATTGLGPTVGGARRLTDRVVERLQAFIPWLSDHLRVIDTPALTVERGSGQPMLDPHELAPVYERPAPMTLDASALAPATPYDNVLLAGDALYGGLGFEGAFFGAEQTLAATRQLLRLKAPLR